jgi:energy-converting hydrogenase Eha subunit F
VRRSADRCEEISRSVGRTEEEREGILDEILTPMLVGGFTTVTTSSILVASVLVSTL